MTIKWKNVVISPSTTIRDALEVLNAESLRIAIVVLDCDKLIGVVTDGDIRRGLLSGIELNEPVSLIMNKSPLSAKQSLSSDELKEVMKEHQVLSLPLVDDIGRLVGLTTLTETLEIEKRENPIFIMAGGFGTRLRPLTDHCPKPMLKVAGKPMLETLINSFKKCGFYKFYISTHYLPEVIMDYFGDGSEFDIEIKYVYEDKPLGTGGALALLPDDIPKLPLIMINGDILTNVDYLKVLDFHNKNDSDATMCVRDYEVKIPFGVIEGKGYEITDIVEKPTYRYFVNAGIYIISPSILEQLNKNQYLDMPTLFEQHNEKGSSVYKFPIHEYWLDIGRMDDFKRAQEDFYSLGLV